MSFFKKSRIIVNSHDFPPPPPQPEITRPALPKRNNVFLGSVVVLLIAIASSGSFFAAWYVKPDKTMVFQSQTLGASDTPPSSVITPIALPERSEDKTLITIESNPDTDGYVSSRGQVVDHSDIKIGSDDRRVYRGLVSFDLDDVPDGANVTFAKLKLYEVDKSGTPSRNGALLVDHLTYGESIEDADYSVPSILSNIADFQLDTRSKWHESDVTFAVREDIINARSSSQFRIHYKTELINQTTDDTIYFESSDNTSGTGRSPILEIEYN